MHWFKRLADSAQRMVISQCETQENFKGGIVMTGPGDEQVVTFCSGLLPPSFYLAVIWYPLTGYFFFFFTAVQVSCCSKRKCEKCRWEMGFQKQEVTWLWLGGDPVPWVVSRVQASGCWSTCAKWSPAVGLSISWWRAPWILLKPVGELLETGPQGLIWFIHLVEIEMCFEMSRVNITALREKE